MNGQELFDNIGQHLIDDVRPSGYLNKIYDEPTFGQYPFEMLKRMQKTEQSPVHHPEGNVWNHTLLVVDQAAKVKAKSSDVSAFMWAALLHDIGKPPVTRIRKNKITAYDHDRIGAKLAEEFLSVFVKDANFKAKVVGLVRYHMHVFYIVKDLPFADVQGMKKSTDIKELALLGLCDRLGRTKPNPEEEKENVELFLKICSEM
ncbi:MAG: HDIG domain-containing protein [Clostridiales bacterium]|nr:HDIG domain-containing protein [Clostridiales bacterium]